MINNNLYLDWEHTKIYLEKVTGKRYNSGFRSKFLRLVKSNLIRTKNIDIYENYRLAKRYDKIINERSFLNDNALFHKGDIKYFFK